VGEKEGRLLGVPISTHANRIDEAKRSDWEEGRESSCLER